MTESQKRSSLALWKITPVEGARAPRRQITAIREAYAGLSRKDARRYPPTVPVELRQRLDGVVLELYVRNRRVAGWSGLIAPYLKDTADRGMFQYRAVDCCLFMATKRSLFAVTSGFGYKIFEEFTDYDFPFQVAKKLVANNFSASTVRELTGPRAAVSEIYRRPHSISGSDSLGKVWKGLIGRIDIDRLPAGSYIGSIIDTKKPPAVEVKSSFTLRRTMNLSELATLARELETLPEATEPQLRQLAFLDNLYPVRNSKQIDDLKAQLLENVRVAALDEVEIDIDVSDPTDIAAFLIGSSYKLSRWALEGDPPDIDNLLSALREHCANELNDARTFSEKFASMWLSYSQETGDDPQPVRHEAWKYLHGQVDLAGQTFFLLDAKWYQAKGDYLSNLKRDFLEEVFEAREPIYMGEDIGLLDWTQRSESAYNIAQATRPGFYFGDEIFAITERGPVELFDLLKVDLQARQLYVIHTKDGFGAKMRDACSQISLSRELIAQDTKTGKTVLTEYYARWSTAASNVDVSLSEFLSWFDLEIVYLVLASTRTTFAPAAFGRTLNSHIARREILTTRNEFRAAGAIFRLAHTHRAGRASGRQSTDSR